jgi:hypothetical protein
MSVSTSVTSSCWSGTPEMVCRVGSRKNVLTDKLHIRKTDLQVRGCGSLSLLSGWRGFSAASKVGHKGGGPVEQFLQGATVVQTAAHFGDQRFWNTSRDKGRPGEATAESALFPRRDRRGIQAHDSVLD